MRRPREGSVRGGVVARGGVFFASLSRSASTSFLFCVFFLIKNERKKNEDFGSRKSENVKMIRMMMMMPSSRFFFCERARALGVSFFPLSKRERFTVRFCSLILSFSFLSFLRREMHTFHKHKNENDDDR